MSATNRPRGTQSRASRFFPSRPTLYCCQALALLFLLTSSCLDDNPRTEDLTPQGPGPIELENSSFEETDLGDQPRLALHRGWEYLQLLSIGPFELAYVVRLDQEDFDTPFEGLVDGTQALAFFPRPVDYQSFLSQQKLKVRPGEVYRFELTVMVPREAQAPTDVALGLFEEPRTPVALEWIDVPEPGQILRTSITYVVPEGAAGKEIRPGFLSFHNGDEESVVYFDHARFERLQSQPAPTGFTNGDFATPALREGLFTYGLPGWKSEQLNYFGVAHHDEDILPGGPVTGENVLELGVRAPEERNALTDPFLIAQGGETLQIDFHIRPRADLMAPEKVTTMLKVGDESVWEEELLTLNNLEEWEAHSYCVTIPQNLTGPVQFGFLAARTGEDDQIQRFLVDDLRIQARSSC